LVSAKSTIQQLIAARKNVRAPNFTVTLGKDVKTLVSVRVDMAQLSTYIIGMPGSGKSNLLAQLFLENQDHSKLLIDPQGKLTNELILPNLHDPSQVIYFAPDEQYQRPIGFNPFDLGQSPSERERDALAGSLRAIFSHLWLSRTGNYTPNMEMVIQNTLNLLVRFEGMTFLEMARVLIDTPFRHRLVYQLDDKSLRDFWLKHYQTEMGISTYNKINEFIQIGSVRRVVCQRKSGFSLSEAMATGKTVIVNLGGLQENATSLLGGLFVSRVLAEFVRRERVPTAQLTPFAVFVDEFDLFGSQAFETIISKCRQQQSSVCIAHQHWGQLSKSMQQSVMQAAYIVAFQVDPVTANGMKGLFQQETDLANVPRYHAWVRANKAKTGAVAATHLIRTKSVPTGNATNAQHIKQQMVSWGRDAHDVDAELDTLYTTIHQYGLTHTFTEVADEQPKEPSTPIHAARRPHILCPVSDWPPRFHNRPSVVLNRVGQ